jgi:HEAT repeat protein
MNNWDDIRALLERYYEGQTTLAEERRLKDEILAAGDRLPADLLVEAQILGWYSKEKQVQSSQTVNDLAMAMPEYLKKIKADTNHTLNPGKSLWPTVWKVAAAVALLIIGYGAGSLSQKDTAITTTQPANPSSTELVALRQEVEAVKQMLASNITTGERLQLVNNAAQVPANQVSNELLLALIQTLHFDDNVNVRLAAAEALLKYQDNPLVRQALARSLGLQTDPNVQLMLIVGLTGMQEKAALPVMEEMLELDSLQPIVKQQLQESIAILL